MVCLSGSVQHVQVFLIVSLYLYFAVEDPIIKRVWDPSNRFNSARIMCLSQARIWISNAKSRGLLYCIQWFEM